MGTGVGEAMLIGAVTGAGTSAITGGDPLKGALFGAVGGGATAGIGGMLGGGAGATSGVASGASAAPAGSFGQVGAAGFGNTLGTAASPLASGNIGSFGQIGASGFGNAALPGTASAPFVSGAAGAGAPVVPPSGGLPNLPSTGDLLSRDSQKTTSALANLINKYPIGAPAAGGAFTNLMLNRPGIDMPGEPDSELEKFRYDPFYYRPAFASGGIADLPVSKRYAGGGNLGGYSDGGRMLKGPGDGMSDSIPARIGSRQPARLADGEFVVPADVVSHLGNGSTDAGAKQLYSMMDKVRKARTGTKKQGREITPRKYMPA